MFMMVLMSAAAAMFLMFVMVLMSAAAVLFMIVMVMVIVAGIPIGRILTHFPRLPSSIALSYERLFI